MKTKMEIRFFFLPNFEKEALYLAEQHRKGWKFIENRFGVLFIFEKCQPEEVVYQLDFKPSLQEEYDYVQFYEDYGWEYVGNCNHFSYFRKVKADGELEIYSDRQSKLEMIDRILRRQLLLAGSMYMLSVILGCYKGKFTFVIGLSIIFIPALCYCLIGLLRLRKKYQEAG